MNVSAPGAHEIREWREMLWPLQKLRARGAPACGMTWPEAKRQKLKENSDRAKIIISWACDEMQITFGIYREG